MTAGEHIPPIGSANLYAGIPAELPREFVQPLLERPGLTVERIVSRGHASPPGLWYDQPRDEWVVLLSGAAMLRFEEGGTIEMRPGDFLLIPAHCRHRVEQTDPAADSVWLAIHIAR
jgi:cupin 2 domain-containing protein